MSSASLRHTSKSHCQLVRTTLELTVLLAYPFLPASGRGPDRGARPPSRNWPAGSEPTAWIALLGQCIEVPAAVNSSLAMRRCAKIVPSTLQT